jgi:hypothetical protein
VRGTNMGKWQHANEFELYTMITTLQMHAAR